MINKVYSKRHRKCVWRFDVRINGKRYRDSGFATKEEASLALGALRLSSREAKYGIVPARIKRTSIRTLVDSEAKRLTDQMTLRRDSNYAKRNIGYVNRLKRWGEFVGLDRYVSSISEEDLLEWVQAELGRGLQKSSVLRGLNTVRAALRQAARKYPDLLTYRIPEVPKGMGTGGLRNRVLEPEEISKLSAVLGGPPPKLWRHAASWRDARDFFLISLATGCRIGDVLSLKWTDVNSHFQFLKVSVQKTDKDPLIIQLTKTVEEVIARRKAEGLGDEAHIFTCRDHSIRDAMRNASTIADLCYGQQVEGGWTVHDLRRTYLTYLLQAGVDIATVRDLAGHSSVAVTSRYVHSTRDSRKNAAIAAEKLVELASGLKEDTQSTSTPLKTIRQ
ncbi:MAG TPA: site-specific integrase [Pyrinomonadaceae bacterium]|nr:site-specific integrase [Pyrinomonadaceae bacterium]